MKAIKFLQFFLFFTLLISMNLFCQEKIHLDIPRLVPVSPETAAMEKYQAYPVDHCTGVPNINIPLYEIVTSEITIPISLSYHASGLKPKESSGIAGTGWMLNLEPSISRQVNGIADENYYGWFNRGRYMRLPHGLEATESQNLTYYGCLTDGGYDPIPDKFTYKLPHGGGSGYFYSWTNPLITLPRNNDKVLFNSDMNITDENGIKYEFDTYETTSRNYEQGGDIITRWLCSSIKSVRHESTPLVTFNYREPRPMFNPNTFYNLYGKVMFTKDDNGNNYFADASRGGITSYYRIEKEGNDKAVLSKNNLSNLEGKAFFPQGGSSSLGMVSTTLLTEANFSGNKLTVSYKSVGTSTTHSEVLNEINITDKDGTLIRNIQFYIIPHNTHTSLTKLDSVVISAPGVEPKVYSFSYYDSGSVPSTYTTAVDHWGFFNGDYFNDGRFDDLGSTSSVIGFARNIPFSNGIGHYHYGTFMHEGANREPYFIRTQVGTLKQITNPQGVQTSFTYEGNYGAFQDNENIEKAYLYPVGGLRTKGIMIFDPKTNKRISKSYLYGFGRPRAAWEGSGFGNESEPIWGGGSIRHIVTPEDYCPFQPTYVSQSNWMEWDNWGTGEPWVDWSLSRKSVITYNSMPYTSITYNNGSPVMYSVVSEIVSTYPGSEVQKTIYYYRPPSGHQPNLRNTLKDMEQGCLTHPYRPSDDFLVDPRLSNRLNGALRRVERYKGDEIVSSTEYKYKDLEDKLSNFDIDVPIRTLVGNDELCLILNPSVPIIIHDNNSPSAGEYRTTYYLDTYNYQLIEKETTKDFFNYNGKRDTVVITKEYSYDPKCLWGDPGISLKPCQIITTGSDGVQVTDSFSYLQNFPGVLAYHKRTKNNHFKESRILFKENSNVPSKVQSRTDQMPGFRDEVVYSNDYNGNPVGVMGKDGQPVFYIWGYSNRFPIAKIENTTQQELYQALFGYVITGEDHEELTTWAKLMEPDDDCWSKINALRTKLPHALVTTYKYNYQHGVVSVTDPNNIVNKFDYDSYSRLTDSYFMDMNSRKVMLEKYIYHWGK